MNLTSCVGVARVLCVVGLLALAGIGCNTKPKGPLTVPLIYRPTDQLNVGAAEGVMTKSVSLVIEDRRDRKDQIGQNTEKAVPVPVYAGTGQPTDLVREALSRALSSSGVAVAQPGGQAERTVVVGLTRFWVDEGNTYNGNVAATVRVLPPGGGQALWEGQVTGTNSRFGRSLSAENYQESLSDAAVQLANRLLAQPGFRNALK